MHRQRRVEDDADRRHQRVFVALLVADVLVRCARERVELAARERRRAADDTNVWTLELRLHGIAVGIDVDVVGF